MSLNWSSGVIVGFVGFIPSFLVFMVTLIQYFKDRYAHLKYFAGMWFFLSIWILFQAISDLLLSIPLHFVVFYALIIFSYFVNLSIDTITRDSIDIKKMILTTIFSSFVVILSLDLNNFPAFNPDAIIIEETGISPYPTMHGNFRIAVMLASVLLVSIAVYGSIKILIHTPKNLKKYSLLNVFGTYLWGIQPIWIQVTHLEKYFPGIATGSMAIGLLIIAITFLKEPKLAYILSFKTYRILIQRTDSGTVLFQHDWNPLETEFSEKTFSGMMQAINTMFDKTINKGNVRKIKFDEAEITFKVSEKVPLACVLITSDSSITLRTSFNKFANDVFKDYSNIEKNDHSMNNYENGSIFLEKHFPFIP
ncbi:MAG: hypothetical protein ACTSPA_05790 [Promethearchaeota archaeon]